MTFIKLDVVDGVNLDMQRGVAAALNRVVEDLASVGEKQRGELQMQDRLDVFLDRKSTRLNSSH